ncbi:MAG: TetR/AcrR family transcriptional regulator [Lactobacillus sp.]|jgi:AcrR family transcriptional regulator|nr:TetR/AcrR family transcriptional regulator [Lactobacillus sp.]MCI2033303.1 TetR/AcrR family transcriptional regulator [Lactobacillus sp.]
MQKPNLELRQKLLDTATEAFVAQGYTAVTISALATQLGISKGNLYTYFANKDALFAACVGDVATTLPAEISRMTAQYQAAIATDQQDKQYFSRIEQALLDLFKTRSVGVNLLLNYSAGSRLAGCAARLETLAEQVTAEILALNGAFAAEPDMRSAYAQIFAHNLIAGLQTIMRAHYPASIHERLLDQHIAMFSAGLKAVSA